MPMATFRKLLIIVSLFGEGFCIQYCNSGWYTDIQNYPKGNCYKVSKTTYTYTMAQRYCQVAGGKLAHINSTEILTFINSTPDFNLLNEYWIGEGSSTTTSSKPSFMYHEDEDHSQDHSENATQYPDLCLYAKVTKINSEFCSEKKFFICESPHPDRTDICPSGFDYYGTNCYRPYNVPQANYEDASKFCQMQKANLASLETEDKEWEAKSALLGKNSTFLVAARKYDGVLKWNNEILFNPIHDIFANYSEGDCVGFLSNPEHPLIFSWAHIKCDDLNSFLCEADPLPPQGTETTIINTESTLAPDQCPHGYNWKSHDISGYCYWETTYETERLNWFQAREFCKLYGGDLASYDNEDQEALGLGGARGHYRGLWIGLQRDENDVFHWVDGNTLNFTNWDSDEPKLSSKSKFCVTHSSGTSMWALDYCGVRRWFICKAPKVRNPTVPDLPTPQKTKCNIEGVSAFRSMWYEYEGECYLIQESNKYTWDTAQLFCQDNGAHMVSIHSFEETNLILSLVSMAIMSIYPDNDFWIGLSAHGLQSSYEWSDGSPLDFIYWADSKSEPKDFNTCVKFNKRDGSWDIDNCNRLQGVVCKRGVNSSYVFTTTEPTTVMPGNCENGWYNLGNKCYKFFGTLWSQRLSWFLAKAECESQGATLVSIHNQDEQDFLTDIVLEAYTDVWIGLQAKEGGTIFHWSDDSRMDYTNWKYNEPEFHSVTDSYLGSRPPELCVEMEYGENIMGKWNDIACPDKKGYICQKMKDPANTEPYQDPFNCANITDWYRLGTACYGFFEKDNRTWLDAQAECKKYGANLITYRNMAVSIFVKRKLKRQDAHFWIGIREKMPDKYEYVTGQPLSYANWMVGQPQAASSVMDNCAATTADGNWLVKSCKDKLPYICKASQEKDPVPEIDRAHSCRNLTGDWKDFGGDHCYLFEMRMRLSWVDAMHYCFKHGGYLASLHSQDEINKISNNYNVYLSPSALHIGLGRKKDGSFSWVDNSPVDFINWDEDEPDSVEKECVEISMRNGKWNAIDCDEIFRGFICSSPKLSLDFEDEMALNTTERDGLSVFTVQSSAKVIRTKLTAGGIFGIVICILVILAVIGMFVYYLRPTKQVQPRLLESDNL